MPFQKGRAKTGGRQPDECKKFKLALTVREKMEDLRFDPLLKMHSLIHDPATPVETVAKLTTDIAKCMYPQLKAVEHTGEGGGLIKTGLDIVVRLVDPRDSIAPADRSGLPEVPRLPLPSGEV